MKFNMIKWEDPQNIYFLSYCVLVYNPPSIFEGANCVFAFLDKSKPYNNQHVHFLMRPS